MNGKVDDIAGIAKPFFMMAFCETFAKSAQSELGAFIAEYDMATKSRWRILSDYFLGVTVGGGSPWILGAVK